MSWEGCSPHPAAQGRTHYPKPQPDSSSIQKNAVDSQIDQKLSNHLKSFTLKSPRELSSIPCNNQDAEIVLQGHGLRLKQLPSGNTPSGVPAPKDVSIRGAPDILPLCNLRNPVMLTKQFYHFHDVFEGLRCVVQKTANRYPNSYSYTL